jgi:hypothetical protein
MFAGYEPKDQDRLGASSLPDSGALTALDSLSRPIGLAYLPTKSATTRTSSPKSNGFAK